MKTRSTLASHTEFKGCKDCKQPVTTYTSNHGYPRYSCRCTNKGDAEVRELDTIAVFEFTRA